MWIKITFENGTPGYVNLDKVEGIHIDSRGYSIVQFSLDNIWLIKEAPEDIYNKLKKGI